MVLSRSKSDVRMQSNGIWHGQVWFVEKSESIFIRKFDGFVDCLLNCLVLCDVGWLPSESFCDFLEACK